MHKKRHPEASLKEIKSFEKNTKRDYTINWNKNK
jgi:hypothetical protein